mgnify:CR=1 FL=1
MGEARQRRILGLSCGGRLIIREPVSLTQRYIAGPFTTNRAMRRAAMVQKQQGKRAT